MTPLVIATDAGLYCEAGGFHIDPWMPVDRAVITHAHSDHAHADCGHYLTSRGGEAVLRTRVGGGASIQTLAYGESLSVNGIRLSLHPAGHMLSSAQIRLESSGNVWVISGDYKTQPDPTCAPFEPVTCETFITESTFGLPIYRWPDPAEVFAEINAWWRQNQALGRTSVIYAYALGKAQRLLAGIDPQIGPVAAHGAVRRFLPAYASAGVRLPQVLPADQEHLRELKGTALVVAPPSAAATPWIRKFMPVSTAFASGWMQIRGARRWRSLDRGFVLSDHADWNGLLNVIAATGARRVGVTHGYAGPLARWLREQGYETWTIATRYGEDEDEVPSPRAATAPADDALL